MVLIGLKWLVINHKNINMKQLLSLFLFLMPCLALAQYPSNGNQKITLGEQTTADGLIFRGVASIDTVTATSKITRTNKQDTSAFILLDTVTNLLWHYKTASNGWSQAGGGTAVTTFSGGTTGLTPSTASSGVVTLGGTLAVANGGTGASVRTFVDTINTQTVNGAKTFTSAVTATRFNPTANTATGTGMFLPAANELGFSVLDSTRFFIKPSNTTTQVANTLIGVNTITPSTIGGGYSSIDVRGTGGAGFILGSKSNTQALMYTSASQTIFQTLNSANFGILIIDTVGVDAENYAINTNRLGMVGIKNISSAAITEALHVGGNARITAVGSTGGTNSALYVTSTGVLSTNSSDVNKKHNIRNLPYGLNTINQLNPVAFDWNENDITDIGFIAQDIESIIPESVITNWDSQLIFRQEKIVPILVKAIQEQHALIKALEQRIINLENK
jgi:hypothetical protein